MNHLDNRLNQLPSSIYPKIAKIDELKGRWAGERNLSPQVLGRLKRSALATSAGASTRIEGSRLSDAEVEKLMRGLTTHKLADRDAQEVTGYYELLQLIFDNYEDIEVTESAILSLHHQLLRYSTKDERHKGQYKHLENRVEARETDGTFVGVIFDTTPAYLTPKAMQELVAWFADSQKTAAFHPLLIIANFIVEFLKVHPFLDGNGRLSRILTNLLLLRAGYAYVPYVSHEKFIENQKAEYYIALRKSQTTFGTDDESVTAWVEYFTSILHAQAEEAIALLEGQNIEQLLSPQQLKVWQYLLEVHEATPDQMSEATQVPRPTVSQVVDRLMELQQIERLGLGRATRYRRIS